MGVLAVAAAACCMLHAAVGPREFPFPGVCDKDFSLFLSWIELTRWVV
jgi:hypothetical protein